MKKMAFPVLIAVGIAAMMMTSFAGTWNQGPDGRWWYKNDDGSHTANGWQQINGKDYYFGADGYMLSNTTTPDGYQVGADGARIGSQSSSQSGGQSTSQSSAQSAGQNASETLDFYGIAGTCGDKEYTCYEQRGILNTTSNWYKFYSYECGNHGLGTKLFFQIDPSAAHTGAVITKEKGASEKSDEKLIDFSVGDYRNSEKWSEYTCKITYADSEHITGTISGIFTKYSVKEKDSYKKEVSFRFNFSTNKDVYLAGENNKKVAAQYSAKYSSGSTSSGSSSVSTDTSISTDTSSTKVDHTCISCHGSGKCTSCAGRGQKRNSYNGEYYDCYSCHGSGQCNVCYGTGKIY